MLASVSLVDFYSGAHSKMFFHIWMPASLTISISCPACLISSFRIQFLQPKKSQSFPPQDDAKLATTNVRAASLSVGSWPLTSPCFHTAPHPPWLQRLPDMQRKRGSSLMMNHSCCFCVKCSDKLADRAASAIANK